MIGNGYCNVEWSKKWCPQELENQGRLLSETSSKATWCGFKWVPGLRAVACTVSVPFASSMHGHQVLTRWTNNSEILRLTHPQRCSGEVSNNSTTALVVALAPWHTALMKICRWPVQCRVHSALPYTCEHPSWEEFYMVPAVTHSYFIPGGHYEWMNLGEKRHHPLLVPDKHR